MSRVNRQWVLAERPTGLVEPDTFDLIESPVPTVADGEFQDDEKELLGEIGAALELTPAHLRGVIDSMVEDE